MPLEKGKLDGPQHGQGEAKKPMTAEQHRNWHMSIFGSQGESSQPKALLGDNPVTAEQQRQEAEHSEARQRESEYERLRLEHEENITRETQILSESIITPLRRKFNTGDYTEGRIRQVLESFLNKHKPNDTNPRDNRLELIEIMHHNLNEFDNTPKRDKIIKTLHSIIDNVEEQLEQRWEQMEATYAEAHGSIEPSE